MVNRHRICSAPTYCSFEPNLEEPEGDIERCPDCGHDLTDETACNVCEWTAPFDDDMCQDCGADIDENEAQDLWKCSKRCGWTESAA